jgi:hypothetical protein
MKIPNQIKFLLNVKSAVILAAFLLMSFLLLKPSEVIQKDKVEVLKFKIIK